MPTVILRATAVGSEDSANIGLAAGSFPTVLETNDGDTSRFTGSDNAGRETFTLEDLPADAIFVEPAGVDLLWAAKRANTNNSSVRALLKRAGSYTNGTTRTLSTGAYQEFSEVGLARPGGGAWDPPSMNASEIGIEKTAAAADSTWSLTRLVAEVDYQKPSGGMPIWFFQILGAAIGGHILLSEMPGLAAALLRSSGGKHSLRPEEYFTAWRELRDHRFPARFFVGRAAVAIT